MTFEIFIPGKKTDLFTFELFQEKYLSETPLSGN